MPSNETLACACNVMPGGVRRGLQRDPDTGAFYGADGQDTPPGFWASLSGRFALVNRCALGDLSATHSLNPEPIGAAPTLTPNATAKILP